MEQLRKLNWNVIACIILGIFMLQLQTTNLLASTSSVHSWSVGKNMQLLSAVSTETALNVTASSAVSRLVAVTSTSSLFVSVISISLVFCTLPILRWRYRVRVREADHLPQTLPPVANRPVHVKNAAAGEQPQKHKA